MTTETVETDRLAGAKEQAKAQFDSIKEMVERLTAAKDGDDQDEQDAAREAIDEDPLSVEVRSDWHAPHVTADDRSDHDKPSEYCILLCTGGPAVRIVGNLNRWCEPESAHLECQDWGTLWTECEPRSAAAEKTLLAYASCFYYGE